MLCNNQQKKKTNFKINWCTDFNIYWKKFNPSDQNLFQRDFTKLEHILKNYLISF